MSSQQSQFMDSRRAGMRELDSRLEAAGWGSLLILLGIAELVPSGQVPAGIWGIALGLILLALNATRLAAGIQTRWFTTVLGVSFLAGGLGEFLNLPLPFWPILIILVGAYILFRPWFAGQER